MSVPPSFQGISRDWRANLTEFASTGYDYDSGQWAVLEGRTASGASMHRTDEPMILTAYTTFPDSAAASAYSYAGGYR